MRKELLAALAVIALGATGALAQSTGDTATEPKAEQNAPAADQAKPDERKARMPMRREQPIVPDPTAPSSEGAGAGTSGADTPSATQPDPKGEEKKY
jgi:hypothetical protein